MGVSAFGLLRTVLFRLEPETAHNLSLILLRTFGGLGPVRAALGRGLPANSPRLRRQIFGLDFPNPIGLAAGFDKNGVAMGALAALGFGHLEVGTVTPEPQPGNPRPRVFRLVEDRALINRLGFPNQGSAALKSRLRQAKPEGVVLGVNLGKGVATPLGRAAEDYERLVSTFYSLADYLVINVSSPNTLGLRRLQARDHLETLLTGLAGVRAELSLSHGHRTPVLVKLSPDLEAEALEDAVGAVVSAGMDGLIVANTTTQRPALRSSRALEAGGLSGKPLWKVAVGCVDRVHRLTQGRLPLIGVGGIFGPEEVGAMLDSGAVLVQIYTGLIYEGPGLVSRILRQLSLEGSRPG